jgi:hypothetical protein
MAATVAAHEQVFNDARRLPDVWEYVGTGAWRRRRAAVVAAAVDLLAE